MQFSSVARSFKPSTSLKLTASAIIGAAGAWILYTFPPGRGSFYPRCVFHATTGLLCPGCGTTHALHELLHGQFGAAFHSNPFLFAVMLGSVYAAPSLWRGETPPLFMKTWFAWASFVVVMAWWIGRNVF